MFMGVIKLVFSFFGGWVQRIVPQAGLLGSLAGIGLGLIGMTPLIDIFGMPLVGVVALGLIFYTLVAVIASILMLGLPLWLRGLFADGSPRQELGQTGEYQRFSVIELYGYLCN